MLKKLILVAAGFAVLIQIQQAAADEEQERRLQQLEEEVEALREEIEDTGVGESRFDRLYIGGYGEMHYNNLNARDPERDLDQIDFHRFVLYFGWDVTDKIRFYSELELEHAFLEDTADGSNPGALELEQAYVQFDFNEYWSALGGIFLIPVGIINPTHEPPTFYGVERNDVENIIIPTTWWAGGAETTVLFGEGFQWDLSIHEGLKIPVEGSNAFRVRSGRQKTAEAVAKDLAGTTRLKYTGYPGLEVAGTFQYQSNPAQGVDNTQLKEGRLFEAHIIYAREWFGLRALYGRWDFDGAGIEAAGADTQQGWYVEPSVKPFSSNFVPILANKVGFYFRYEDIPDAARSQDEFDQWEVGFNFWPIPDVVLKFDYRDRSHRNEDSRGRDFGGFDLGIGYQF